MSELMSVQPLITKATIKYKKVTWENKTTRKLKPMETPRKVKQNLFNQTENKYNTNGPNIDKHVM